MYLNKLIRLANSFYKTIFKKDKAKLKKYDKATRKAGSEAELKRSIRQAINEVKGKDPRTDATLKRFEQRMKQEQLTKRKEEISKLPKFTSKASNIEQRKQRKILVPKGKEKARFISSGKREQIKTDKARSSIERTANQRIKKDPILDKARSTVDRSARQGIKRNSKQIKEKLNKSKSDNPRAIVEKAGQMFTKKGEKARVEKLIKSKEFNKLKQEYKNTKDPVKKRTLKDKLKIAAGIIGLSAGAMAFLISDPKVKPTKINPNNNPNNNKNNNNKNNNRNNNNTVKPDNNNNNNAKKSTIDAGKKRRDRLIAENKRAMELRKRERLKDQARANAKKKILQRNNKAKQPSKSLSKYDKYDYYDPSFLGIRSRLKKK